MLDWYILTISTHNTDCIGEELFLEPREQILFVRVEREREKEIGNPKMLYCVKSYLFIICR